MSEDTKLIQLLRKMGHDMRVPLNTIISTGEMLLGGAYDPLTPKQDKAVTRMQRNNMRLLAILDDFVSYVKADAGELDLNPKPFDLRAQMTSWCAPLRSAAEEKGLALHIEISADVPATITADEALVKRIVQALLWNAVSYTAKGEIHVTVEWTTAPEYFIRIKDTGSGITSAHVPQIFEPFWRGEQRPQMPTANAGLGLPLALALAKLMGGTVTLQETSPSGSTFCAKLSKPRTTEPLPPLEQAAKTEPDGSKLP